ncbi:DUF2303 family protein [Eikenella halliae]|uniref:DUF2303 domain-containing protein n=1 Tax=Eikenella halliae TaxID=1795832 RepID=A0A1B6W0Y3_9NEIS|nr:DUF2303 family protein [Eikenella halliae]OAM44307.1 hypothetical protein A7Q00_01795 [Eikenella halliae]
MENQNDIIRTALDAAQKPFIAAMPDGTPVVFNPNGNGGWNYNSYSLNRAEPARKKGFATAHDLDSLIAYVKKHQTAGTEIYINADFLRGDIGIRAVLNGDTAEASGFKDFGIDYQPVFTPAAREWKSYNGEKLNQIQFAGVLTNNARDIVSSNPDDPAAKYPTGSEVLDFALNLEYTEKTTFKQGYREQDGRMNFVFQSEDAGKTDTTLKAFEKFGVAFTPFLGGKTYFVEALLKFRIDKNNGGLILWYELQQLHRVMELAAQDIAKALREALPELPIYNGKPA